MYGIVSCYKEVQHYATNKTKSREKRTNDRITGNALGDAVALFAEALFDAALMAAIFLIFAVGEKFLAAILTGDFWT